MGVDEGGLGVQAMCDVMNGIRATEDEEDRRVLRDYFAAQALVGLLANPQRTGPMAGYAREAYEQADAMLEARKVKDE